MAKKLLIVESPAKAKTIGKYLGSDFVVKSSIGHIRDLPGGNNAIAIVPDGEKHWSFTPTYEISEGKTKVVNELKAAVKTADEIYLASDPDREGEAIAWHLYEVLKKAAGDKPFHRVTYNEITKSAVQKAVAAPREIDMPLVDAQQARRILDRLVGYKVSPMLWRNIQCPNNRTLSAGRVQSVALRLLVERQREIEAFKPETYFLMGVEAKKRTDPKEAFVARLARLDGNKPELKGRQAADNLLLDLADSELEVIELKTQAKTRHPLPPFTTSTLQQAASSVLGFSPGITMRVAQSLYEQGRITYMRSDSVAVSNEARAAAKTLIESAYGAEFYPEKPNFYKSKADAQGAHEAIRPAHVEVVPSRSGLKERELKLYDLIWRRFVASQMADARTTLDTAVLAARKPALAHEYMFTASATRVDFEGFLKVMKLSLKKKSADGEDDQDSDEVQKLPPLAQGERLDAIRWIADEKQTKGPAHYSEASLVKALEENGVGRPSTYAATIETLKAREYAKNDKKKLIPLERGILVCDWLTKKLDDLFNVGYTAEMEAELDKVAEKGEPMDAMLSAFYAKFTEDLAKCDPPPDPVQIQVALGLLAKVAKWKDPKKIGRHLYDDRAFVESVRQQATDGKAPISRRQLEALVKLAIIYAEQIPNAMEDLRKAGLLASGAVTEKADPELVKYAFDILDRCGGTGSNRFLTSLRAQYDRGRMLSAKQFSALARAVGELAGDNEFGDGVRAKLVKYVPDGFKLATTDNVTAYLEMMKNVHEWRPSARRGRKVYDDKSFVDSLAAQYASRHSLSPRQLLALQRVVVTYRTQIPRFNEVAESVGLAEMAAADTKRSRSDSKVERAIAEKNAAAAAANAVNAE